MYDGFIYEWTSLSTNMKYIGSHKGRDDDGYISSSKTFLSVYYENPTDFVRVVLEYVVGDIPAIRAKETMYLKRYSVSSSAQYYNKSESAFGANMSGISNPMYGVPCSDERKQKSSNAWKVKIQNGYTPHNKGKAMSADQKDKISDIWEIIYPDGKIEKISNMREFCIKHNLNPSAMSSVARGNRRHYKGYKCKKVVNNRAVTYVFKEWESKGKPGCQRFGKLNNNAKSVTINGHTYDTMLDACTATGLSRYKLRKIINE